MSKLDDVIQKVNEMHECLTGGMEPEKGLLVRQQALALQVTNYHDEDEKMHRFIKRWLLAITAVIIYGLYGDKIHIDPGAIGKAIAGLFL